MKYTKDTFAATLAILATGTTLEAHAANLASAGLGVVADTFVASHNAYAQANAYTVSVAAVNALLPKAKGTKAKGALALAHAVKDHNFFFGDSRMACVLLPTGEYTVMELAAPKAKGKGKGKGSGGRMSAHVIATKGSKTDGYKYDREGDKATGYIYTLNNEIVPKLSKALAELSVKADCYTDKAMRKYYPKLY